MPNRLSRETSPYLLQHAGNPVDWYPWGKEALDKAAREEKPVFLSIGYSACHWCHVMERESFTDPELAEVLNRSFVSIKVDREERPDLDSIYMDAVTNLTGRGGWPLSVWLTPTGAPFYGGTYFPDLPRSGMPSFRQVLEAIAEAWADRREDIEGTARTLVDRLAREHGAEEGVTSAHDERAVGIRPGAEFTVDTGWRDRTIQSLRQGSDDRNGGWGGAPKFPQPLPLQYLLADYALNRDPDVRQQFELALDSMAAGGIYDHLGGGFHRYSTDERWLVPHFEKMLYDNALLATCYLRGWQLTGKRRYREVAEETLDYVLREMTSADGAFFSAQDADSEGEEGRFFVWRRDEVEAALGAEAELFSRSYGVTAGGNFEGRNVLSLVQPPDHPRDTELLTQARGRLLAVRDRRVHPDRDEKALAAWNGLMLTSLAEAARAFESERYLEAARNCGEFLLREMLTENHRLVRSWKGGVRGGNGYLEDYADVCDGLLALYQATFVDRWFVAARTLADSMILHFRHPAGGFFDTSDDHEALITRPRSLQDNVLPSGNSKAAIVLLRLAAFTGEGRYQDLAEGALRTAQRLFDSMPVAFGQWLQSNQLLTAGVRQVAVVGPPRATDTEALLRVVFAKYRPDKVVAGKAPGAASSVPMLDGKEPATGPRGADATAWVCAGHSCSAPTTKPEELLAILENGRPHH